ncbi:MAG: flagellar assembly protein FliW [Candidatus Omnitrophica bacterium]|nr:flagellar assembly protein FliW [Candidatus Omnitrophota bacterium]
MEAVKSSSYEVLDLKPEHIFTFPDGIPGFEKVKRFVILTHPQEAPFGRLTALDYDLCFFVVIPWVICPDYKPDIDEEDLKKIDSPSNEEILILSIVNIPSDPKESTMNLVAPLIINTKKGLGSQVIINNFKEYSPKFKLWQEE